MSQVKDLPRAYWHYNGQWKHVYIMDRYHQQDIFGQDVEICTIKLTKQSREKYDVEASKLQTEKPRRPRTLS